MYEITFITKEEKDPGVKKTIESLEGKIVSESSLGRRKFFYPIKKEEAGFYLTYILEINPEKLTELDKQLKLNNEILRFLIIAKKLKKEPIIKKEKVVRTVEKITETKKEEVPIVKVKKTSPFTKPEKNKVFVKKVEKVKEKELVDEEERLKMLEDKLDELLKE